MDSQKQAHSVQNSDIIESNLQQTKESENNEHFLINKCRVCLDIANIPIFGNIVFQDISNDIETFGNIRIRNDDNYPKHICECCKKLLQAAVLFRQTAEQTDMYLKSQHENSNTNSTMDLVKSEVEIDIEDSNVDIESDSPIIDPSCFLNLDSKDAFNTEESDINKKMITVEITVNENNYSRKKYSKHKISSEHKKARLSNKIEGDILTNDKDEKLQCPICNKSYSKTYFNYHITHTHNKAQSKRIQCNICNKSFEKQYYKFHLAIHNNDSSRYVCDTCGKSFIQHSAFKRHHLIHGNELAFKCTLCPYRGRHPGLVKTHMQTHTRDYQHRCMECPARFLTKSNLNKHLQRHKGPVDFKCDACKRGFYSKLELERHFEVDHLGVKNHVCNICGKAFGYRNAMMSHQLKVHKREKITNGKGRLPLYLEADRNQDESK